MSRTVDLNADLGEEVTDDDGLLAVVTSANVACGYHAGSRAIMRRVCAAAARLGVAVGAQVSYDDRAGFGRVALDVPYAVLRDQVADQVTTPRRDRRRGGHRGAVPQAARRALPPGGRRRGAGPRRARRLGRPAGARHAGRAGARRSRPTAGRAVHTEGFPDRAYGDDGRLRPRTEPGAVLDDSATIAARAVDLAAGVDSVCVHGDTPGAVGHARAVRAALEAAGYRVRALRLTAPSVHRSCPRLWRRTGDLWTSGRLLWRAQELLPNPLRGPSPDP